MHMPDILHACTAPGAGPAKSDSAAGGSRGKNTSMDTAREGTTMMSSQRGDADRTMVMMSSAAIMSPTQRQSSRVPVPPPFQVRYVTAHPCTLRPLLGLKPLNTFWTHCRMSLPNSSCLSGLIVTAHATASLLCASTWRPRVAF